MVISRIRSAYCPEALKTGNTEGGNRLYSKYRHIKETRPKSQMRGPGNKNPVPLVSKPRPHGPWVPRVQAKRPWPMRPWTQVPSSSSQGPRDPCLQIKRPRAQGPSWPKSPSSSNQGPFPQRGAGLNALAFGLLRVGV